MNKPIIPNIIDIEASGFGSTSYPIEVGVVFNDINYCSLIIPQEDWTHWDEQAETVHQVSRDLLYTHGKDVFDIAEELNQLLEGQTVYSDGWVVDKPWLIRIFEAAKMQLAFRISPLEMILSEAQMDIWHEEKETVIEQLQLQRHRASNDALIIQQTYIRTKQITG